MYDAGMIAFLENLGYFVDFVGPDGRYIYASKYCYELAGISQQDIMGKHVTEIYGDDCMLWKSLTTGKTYKNALYMFMSGTGAMSFWLFDCGPIVVKGEMVGVLGVCKPYEGLKAALDHLGRNGQFNANFNQFKGKRKKQSYCFDDIIHESPVMRGIIANAKKIALNSSAVLITGETGTGKELFAQSIHNHSRCSEGPFVAINCSAIPDTLIESTLFGSVKGSFTGATDKKGLFEEANKGTLFLDELNSMNIELQAKLLRVLQSKTVQRVGSSKEVEVDPRIICAMNIEPATCIQQGLLRPDLFYRVAAVSVHIAPLRDRPEDILPLTECFISKYNLLFNKNIRGISNTVRGLFYQYKWPGNVRELQHVIEHAMNMINPEEFTIQKNHLPFYFLSQLENISIGGGSKKYHLEDYRQARSRVLEEAENDFIKTYIPFALESTNGNVLKAAERLNISRQRLYQLINKHNLTPNKNGSFKVKTEETDAN